MNKREKILLIIVIFLFAALLIKSNLIDGIKGPSSEEKVIIDRYQKDGIISEKVVKMTNDSIVIRQYFLYFLPIQNIRKERP